MKLDLTQVVNAMKQVAENHDRWKPLRKNLDGASFANLESCVMSCIRDCLLHKTEVQWGNLAFLYLDHGEVAIRVMQSFRPYVVIQEFVWAEA